MQIYWCNTSKKFPVSSCK